MSRVKSCSCRLIVCVETISGLRGLVLDFALAGHGQDCRNEIRETLADAGPRFDDQVRLLRDGPLDGGRHFELLRPLFVRPQPLGDASLFAEHGSRIRSHRSRR